MISFQTNVNSLVSQENLRVNSAFQSNTIQQLTSGYRINQAGDDAAGLAVANKFRSDVAELTQGVRNANDGAGQLQIMDGGLNNISKILDRLKTLATESASSTFTGDRSTLNNEYQTLLGEVDRQASNIGLVNNGQFNKMLSVYLGGGSTQGNAQVNVDLSGTANQVDSGGLSLSSTDIQAGGTTLAGNGVNNLNSAATMLLAGGAGNQTFTINYIGSSGAQSTLVASITSTGTAGITVAAAVTQLNSQLNTIGLSAAVDQTGSLVIGGDAAYSVVSTSGASIGTGLVSAIAANAVTANAADYNASVASTVDLSADSPAEVLAFTNGTVTKNVTLDPGASSTAAMVDLINAQTASMGIYAVASADTGILANANCGFSIQSSSNFSITVVTPDTPANGPWAALGAGGSVTINGPDQSASVVGNSLSALTAIETAVGKLGQVQGRVGAGENQLQYAINLAQSQITNYSSADSNIRDADIAAEAANLSKAQVLQQASIAAMAQANSAPQQILALLRG